MKDKQALLSALTSGKATVNFVKADDTNRTLQCTLNDELMTEYTFSENELTEILADAKTGLVRAYDLEKSAWRSFRTESVTDWAQA